MPQRDPLAGFGWLVALDPLLDPLLDVALEALPVLEPVLDPLLFLDPGLPRQWPDTSTPSLRLYLSTQEQPSVDSHFGFSMPLQVAAKALPVAAKPTTTLKSSVSPRMFFRIIGQSSAINKGV